MSDETIRSKILHIDNIAQLLTSSLKETNAIRANLEEKLSENVAKRKSNEDKQRKREQLENLVLEAQNEIAKRETQIVQWENEIDKLHDCEYDGHCFDYDDDGGPMSRYCQHCRRCEEEFRL